MSKVLIIGAGGVGSVVTHKCAQVPEVFSEICLASRTLSKCNAIRDSIETPIKTAQIDADNVPELVKLINEFQPELVINVALPYQDLTIMDACLETGVNYLDTANYEPIDEAKFCYKWQCLDADLILVSLMCFVPTHGKTILIKSTQLTLSIVMPVTTEWHLQQILIQKLTSVKSVLRANTTKQENG